MSGIGKLNTVIAAALVASVAPVSASAATTTFSEVVRSDVSTDFTFGELTNSFAGPNLNLVSGESFGAGDSFSVFGRVANRGNDAFRFTFDTDFNVSLDALASVRRSLTSTTLILRNLTTRETQRATVSGGGAVTLTGQIFGGITAGTYGLRVDGGGPSASRALYDITIAAVPLPGALALMLAGVAAFGAVAAGRKTAG